MFDDIDAVPWGELIWDYTPYLDIPAALRDVFSQDALTRLGAMEVLDEGLLSEGNERNAASVRAIPFFLKMLRDETLPDKSAILLFVMKLALDGTQHDYGALNYRERYLDKCRRTGSDPDEMTSRCYHQAALGVPIFLKLLEHPHEEVREAAVYSCVWFPAAADSALRKLDSMLEIETDEMLLVNTLAALRFLGDACQFCVAGDIYLRLLGNRSLLVRAAAAAALGVGSPESDKVLTVLAEVFQQEVRDLHEEFHFATGFVAYIARVLRTAGEEFRGKTLPILWTALEQARSDDFNQITYELLEDAQRNHSGPAQRIPVGSLDQLSIRTLKTLADLGIWYSQDRRRDDLRSKLSYFGFPDSPSGIREYLNTLPPPLPGQRPPPLPGRS